MRIRFFVFIFCALLVSACSTRRVVTETTDTSQTYAGQRDSTQHAGVVVDAGTQQHEAKHIYDSIFTHVTIYKYDTITQKVVEKIVIEQQHIQKDETQTDRRDSLQVAATNDVAVHSSDSAAVVEHHEIVTEKSGKARNRLRWVLFILAMIGAMIIGYKARQMFRE